MKLTDAKVAKALGWKRYRTPTKKMCWKKPPFRWHTHFWIEKLPAFTTSLEIIVGEIEAHQPQKGYRGWDVKFCVPGSRCEREPFYRASVFSRPDFEASTAPLALCSALLAYLKEPRP